MQVLPAWRPEAAMKIADKGFATYVRRLAGAAEMDIGRYDDFKAAMIKRLEFFNQMGCRASDHSLDLSLIHISKRLLEYNPDMRIAMLTELIGYPADGQYFSKTFRKVCGMTPTEYLSLIHIFHF